MTDTASVENSLALREYAELGSQPFPVVRPASVDGVSDCLAEARRGGTPVVVVGGRTGLGRGNPSAEAALGVDITNLGQVVEYEPADMTITVQAGARLGDVQALVAKHSQSLALEGANPASATLGGVVATASWGPHLGLFGRVRDRVIGLQVVDGSGVVRRSGGRVVKNVSGFDLSKLHIGASGSLGVITEISLKLQPVSGVRIGLAVVGVEPAAAIAAGPRVRSQAWALRRSASTWTLVTEWWLPETVASDRRSAARDLTRALGREHRDMTEEDLDAAWTDSYLEDRSWAAELYVPRASAEAAIAATGAASEVWLWPDTGTGRITFADEPGAVDSVASVRTAIEALGGRLIVARRPLGTLQPDAWGTLPGNWFLQQRIKDLYDPARILNRGRFWGGL